MDAFADRTIGIGVLVEVKQLAAVKALYRIEYIKQGDLTGLFGKARASRTSLDLDQPGFLELTEQLADNDGIDLNARRKKIACNLVLALKGVDTAENMDRYRESA